MDANDDAGCLNARVAPAFLASMPQAGTRSYKGVRQRYGVTGANRSCKGVEKLNPRRPPPLHTVYNRIAGGRHVHIHCQTVHSTELRLKAHQRGNSCLTLLWPNRSSISITTP